MFSNNSHVFSGDNFSVSANLNLREVKDKKDVTDNEHLIEIFNPNAFEKTKQGEEIGGDTELGGLYIRLSSNVINEDGTVRLESRMTLSHELGHTGGLEHPFEIGKSVDFSKNFLGVPYSKKAPTFNQTAGVSNPRNFMSYPTRFNDEFTYDGIQALRRIYTSPQGATKAQLAAIIKYYTLGLLNNNNK